MKTWTRRLSPLAVGLFYALAGTDNPPAAIAQTSDRVWDVPVVMEQATVRGRILILETRREDRHAIKSMPVQVWNNPAQQQNPGGADATPKLLHETTTDETGIFTLPVLEVGEYRLFVGDLRLRLTVVPKAEVRKGQEEPKILLILIPKEVIRTQEQQQQQS